MGVPKFYRWLSERYPLINQAIDESTLLPGLDNLYLDMNGIIHNATHGNEGITKALTEKDVMLSILAYVDGMVKLVKPQTLLYMAVDGVAPRAKMNQQRSRRFRAARDLAEARTQAALKGEEVAEEDVFDSNCITPGTEFMVKVSTHMKFFIRMKLKLDPAWQRFRVIFSGHEVPGEGEHKIMAYIRQQRMRPGYDANTRHCVAGLDADLIMLALATHEPHFTLLREQVDFNSFKSSKFSTKTATRETKEKKWQLLHIGILREYLEIDLRPPTADSMAIPYDGERVVDDFVLMCALCGNDFTPHLPSMDIGEGAVDNLIRIYKEKLPGWGGYLTDEGLIELTRLEDMLVALGSMETDIFAARAREAARFARKQRHGRRHGGGDVSALGGQETSGVSELESDTAPSASDVADEDITPAARAAAEEAILAATIARLKLESGATGVEGESDGGSGASAAAPVEVSFKERYYMDKFGISYRRGSAADDAILHRLVHSFIEALQWVMLYYYRGCPSWGWFFPFHYAPMTSDLVNLAADPVAFRLGQPFRPFQQLLGCLPAASGKFLPAPYRALMTETWSPLLTFYPPVADIKIDMNGKRNPWEGITLIPFIQEEAMLDALRKYCPDTSLTDDERKRNSFGLEYVLWFDESAHDTVVSTLPGAFPDIPGCQTRVAIVPDVVTPVLTRLPAAAALENPASAVDQTSIIPVTEGFHALAPLFSARPRAGCVVPAAGYPTLHTLPFTPIVNAVRLNIFGSASKKASLTVAVGSGRKLSGELSDEEDNSMLAAAALFHEPHDAPHGAAALSPLNPAFHHHGHGGGHGHSEHGHAGGNGHVHVKPFIMSPHTPQFSVAYAEGTTVASARTGGTLTSISADVASIVRARTGAVEHDALRARDVAPLILGKVVFVEWPHLREARVVCVSDSIEEARWDEDSAGTAVVMHNLTPDAQVAFARTANAMQAELLAGRSCLCVCGIQVGAVRVVVTVQKLIGMRREPLTGALTRVFAPAGSTSEISVTPDLILLTNPTPDTRFIETGPQALPLRFPAGTQLVLLRGPGRGCSARVVGVEGTSLALDASVVPPESAFGHTIATTVKDKFFDAKKAAEVLGITTNILGRITASVYVNPGGYDIGLNLKINRGVYLPGYVRSVSREALAPAWGTGSSTAVAAAPATMAAHTGAWEYTERTIHLVAAYQRAWPAVFALLESDDGSSGLEVKSFPGRDETVERICTWLQQLETYSRGLVPLQTQVMCPDAIRAVQKAADTLNARPERQPRVQRMTGVSPRDVYVRETQSYAVGAVGEGLGTALGTGNVDGPSCIPMLGDRIVNLSFKKAPLGARGTVVATHPASGFVEVVFDEEFVGGSTLGGLCANGRGGLVPWSALLCASREPTPVEAAEAAVAEAAAGGVAMDGMPRGKRVVGSAAAAPAAAPAMRTTAPTTAAPSAARASAAPNAASPSFAQGPQTGSGFSRRGGGATPTVAEVGDRSDSLNLPAIATQVQFYFSDSNLRTDDHLKKLMAQDTTGQGWVRISEIAKFKMMKRFAGGDAGVIAAAVSALSGRELKVSDDKKSIARITPYTLAVPVAAAPAAVASPAPPMPAPAPVPAHAAQPVAAAATHAVAAVPANDHAAYWSRMVAPPPLVSAPVAAATAAASVPDVAFATIMSALRSPLAATAASTAAPVGAPAASVAPSVVAAAPSTSSSTDAALAASRSSAPGKGGRSLLTPSAVKTQVKATTAPAAAASGAAPAPPPA